MKEMLIRLTGDEVSIALCHQGQLVELYLPETGEDGLLGSIYKGRVVNVLPGMQAAFVDIGLEKNSFLYVDDVYRPAPLYGALSQPQEPAARREIGALLREGQEVLVQIFKAPVGGKGARVTMQPSLPGRYAVLLPKGDYIAISRRIEDEEERERLRALMKDLLTGGGGVIIRTAAAGISREELAEDVKALARQWKRIQGKAAQNSPPALIYRDLELLKRVIRGATAADVQGIVVESADMAARVREVMEEVAPGLDCRINIHEGQDIFSLYGLPEQIEKALKRKLWLKSGGYIVFDYTEALTVVDVNTGKYVGGKDLDDTVLTTNLEAVTEISRQLRLRNIGGIIVIDFINMELPEHKQTLMEALAEELKKDRTRITMLGMTNLGLVELTRKKNGHELSYILEKECPCCLGKGRVRKTIND